MTDTAAKAWERFLEARATIINEHIAMGDTFEGVASRLSCDAAQARAIFDGCGPNGPFNTDGTPKAVQPVTGRRG